MPGPPPKRSEERRRRNKDDSGIETIKVNLDEVLTQVVEIPAPPMTYERKNEETGEIEELAEPEPKWHRIAHEAYLSLARSGQVIFMEPSDWATAQALCEMLSRELKPKPIVVQVGEGETEIQWVIQPVNGAVMNAFLKGWAALMATEGDRRRLRIELNRQKNIDAALSGDNKVVSITQSREVAFKRAREARGS